MPITRRSLFKYLGAAIVAAPFLISGSAQATECGIVPPEREFMEKAFNCNEAIGNALEDQWEEYRGCYGTTPLPQYLGYEELEAKVHYTPPTTPSMSDPLGQWGILGWKVRLPNGEQYGSWIEITDISGNDTEVLIKSLPYLREQMEETLSHVAPNVTVATTLVSVPDYQGDSWLLKNGTFIF